MQSIKNDAVNNVFVSNSENVRNIEKRNIKRLKQLGFSFESITLIKGKEKQ